MGCVANVVQSLKLPEGTRFWGRSRPPRTSSEGNRAYTASRERSCQKETGVDAEGKMTGVSLFEQYVSARKHALRCMIAAVRVATRKLADIARISVEWEKQNCSNSSLRSNV